MTVAIRTRPNIVERLRQDGHLVEVMESLLGFRIEPDKTTAARCLNPAGHANGDQHPSKIVKPTAGSVECPACGLSEGLLDLAVRRGIGKTHAEAAARLEDRWFGGDGRASTAPRDDGAKNGKSRPQQRRKQMDYPKWWRESRERMKSLREEDPEVRRVTDAWGWTTLDELGVGFMMPRGRYGASLVFPVESPNGKVVGLKLRSLRTGESVKSRALGRVSTGLLGRGQLSTKKDAVVVICAGEKDLVSGVQAAPEYAWVSLATGEGARLGTIVQPLFRKRHVVVLYDKDNAGRRGAEKLSQTLVRIAETVRVAEFPDEVLSGAKDEKDVVDLCRLLGSDAGAALRKIIEDAPPCEKKRELPQVILRDFLHEVADEAERALAAAPDAGLYARAGLLVRVVHQGSTGKGRLKRPKGSPLIEVAVGPYVRECLDRAANFVKIRQSDHGVQILPALPPIWVVDTLMARGQWQLPVLEGTVEAPTLRPDGTVLAEPGYDAATGLLVAPSVNFPAVPDTPTAADVRAAISALLDPFTDFPFVAESDRAAAVSALLTVVGRAAIDGPAPLFAVRAPTPGTGKTLIVDIVSLVATGRPAARMTVGRDDNETRKLILSIGLEGAPIVLIDNVEGMLGSPALAAALTSTTFRDRLLGVSKLVTVSLGGTTWFATGNGLSFKGDLGRRVLPIDLDAGVEHPEDRGGFKHEDVLAFVRTERPKLVAAALTVLRAYHVAGRPKHGQPRVGSFESWDDLVRGVCIWSGLGDPVAGRKRIRDESDADLDVLRDALTAWHETFGPTALTVRAAIEKADENGELRGAFAALAGCSAEKLSTHRLGYALRRVRGRLVGRMRFEWAGRTHGKARWRVSDGEHDVVDMSGDAGRKTKSTLPNGVQEGGSCCAA